MQPRPLISARSLGLLAIVVLCWGINWPITKVIVRDISPLWSTSMRCGIAAIVLAALLRVRGAFVVPKRGDLPVILSTSLLHMTAYSALVAAGLQFLPAGRAIVLGYTTPIWVVLGAHFFLAERITARTAIGVVSGLAGLAVIFAPGSLDWSDPHALLGCGLVMAAAFCWAANIVYVRAHIWVSSPFQLAFWQLLLAFIVLAATALVGDGVPHVAWTTQLVLLLAFSGVVCTALAHWAMSVVNRILPAITTSLGLLATPALGIASGIVVLGEPFEPSLLIALLLLVGGIALGVTSDRRRPVAAVTRSTARTCSASQA